MSKTTTVIITLKFETARVANLDTLEDAVYDELTDLMRGDRLSSWAEIAIEESCAVCELGYTWQRCARHAKPVAG